MNKSPTENEQKIALQRMYDEAAEQYRDVIMTINTFPTSLPQNTQSAEINIHLSCRNTPLKVTAKTWKERMKWLDIRLKEFSEE